MSLPGPALPVDAVLPELAAALGDSPCAVLQAPPGAGKTTRVPLALAKAEWLRDRSIVMLEPRRLAARTAARRLAHQLGERVGEMVGVQVRLETKRSARTRIEVVTEGILTRRLLGDPALERGPGGRPVGVVLFDEYHERSLQADLGLALCLQAQALLRPDLKILVMSATLDGARVASLLGPNTPIVSSEGRTFPITTHYLGGPHGKVGGRPARIEDAVADAVRQALREETGSVLAFLPGLGEIRRTAERLDGTVRARIAPLYGTLSASEQDAAISPARDGERKVVLATSIAETSLTIEGVRVVVDSGLARRPRFDAGSGMSRLETVRVSAAEADQRQGRAGRTEPGVAYRLWSQTEQAALQPFAPPEIAQADLAPLALDLAAWGAAPEDLEWLDPPPDALYDQARDLLRQLDALDAEGHLTDHGRAMAELAMHPRLAHMAITAGRSGLAADLAALLGERDVVQPDGRHQHGRVADVDLRLRVEALRGQDASAFRGLRLDRGALHRAREQARRWRRQWTAHDASSDLHDAGRLLALAYPDRVAQRVAETAQGARFRLREGRSATLDPGQPLADSPFLAVGDLDDRHGGVRVFLAAPLTVDDIEDLFASSIVEEEVVTWDAEAGSVRARRVRRLGAVILKDAPLRQPDPALVRTALAEGLRAAGLASLGWSKDARRLRERLAFLHQHEGRPWPNVSDDALLDTLDTWLGTALATARRLSDLARADLSGALLALVPWDKHADLDRLAPSHVTVPSGSRIPIDYSDPAAPVLAVRLQEVFGLTTTPTVLGGRVPLLMHLLSPAGRPAQMTTDLASFWRDTYFDVRKDLRGRYPKHHWPENPLEATPTARVKRRR
ncbi:MAG: ATP-dependent helicase HrpB [Rubricoccaceae bacterium]